MELKMKLIECYIENFGRLSDFKYSFSDGLNVIKRENGYGKTTLSVFIKAMFFGLDESRRSKIEENDRKRYLPWSGARCAGYLIFEAGGKRYRIERSFMPKAADDTFMLYDVKSNKESRDFSKNIGEELFGIDEEGFERTVFLSEANLSGTTENKKIASKLSDLVGCEGDIGVMDDAIALLEKQRKAYYRKGGAGEIGELLERLTATELKINDLARMRQALNAEEERLAAAVASLNVCYEERKKLQSEARAAELARSRRTYERQYREMKRALEEDEKTFAELGGFFLGGTVPESEEVENVRAMHAEVRRIRGVRADGAERTSTPFSSTSLTEDDYERARAASNALKAKEREREILKTRLEELSAGSGTGAGAEKIESHISALSGTKNGKNANKSWRNLLISSILIILAGAVLAFTVTPVCAIASAVGALLLIISSVGGSRARGTAARASVRAAVEFAAECKPELTVNEDNILNILHMLKGEADAALQRREKITALNAELAEINDEISEISRTACEFLAHFPNVNASSVAAAVDTVLQRHTLELMLSDAARQDEAKRREELLLAEKYTATVDAFLAGFATVSSRPFDEINEKIIEYNTLKRSVLRGRRSIEAFIAEHGINPEMLTSDIAPESAPNPDDPTLLAKISELEKEKTLLERQCRAYSDELERIDELNAERDTCSEELAKAKRALEINQKTQKLLKEAKDNLTARYLSKTKLAFDKFMSDITGEEASDYQMDTSFGVSKNERGTLRATAAYSRGMRDATYLATRLALVESLYEGEKPFIILDDPFAYLDDARLSRSLRALTRLARERQLIYFTCQDSRKP